MLDYNELRMRLNSADTQMKKNISNLRVISEDAKRVSEVAKNASVILDNIDRNFEEKTKLTKIDITFLFFAAALQVGRQILLSNDTFRITADEGDKLIKSPLKKAIKDKTWQDILLGSVPYDAVNKADGFTENIGISGTTHRYLTLGHDPVLGWIFGPVNIITDSLTKSNFVETYAVENMHLTGTYPDGTFGALKDSFALIIDGLNSGDIERKLLLPAAVAKQAIHFGADYFTKQGLPVPFISSLGTSGEAISKELLTRFEINIYSVTRGMIAAVLINSIIEIIHKLFYNENTDGSLSLYEVRTRKILMYSNILSSGINIIQVAVRSAIGDVTAVKNLDIGGFIVTLYRIATDVKFIGQIKKEFLEKEFYNVVMGDDFDF